jgi:hypothetical protein
MLITMGAEDYEGTAGDFLGAEMYWSHFGPAENRKLVEAAEFKVRLDEIDASSNERHQIILAIRE